MASHAWQCSLWKAPVSGVLLAHGALQLFIAIPLILLNRNQDYFRIRSPVLLSIYCSYACLIQIVVATQEIVICLNYEWPGFVFWLMSLLYIPLLSAIAIIRATMVMVRFSPRLRLTPKVKFLQTEHNVRFFGVYFTVSAIVFLILLGIFPQYRSMNVGRWSSINGEWYLFLPYSLYSLTNARALGESLDKMDDLFGAAGETKRAYFTLAFFPVCYYIMECVTDYAVPVFGNCHIITTSIVTGDGGRQCLEQVALPLQFFFALGMAVYVHVLTTRPLFDWYSSWRYMIIDQDAISNKYELSLSGGNQIESASRDDALYGKQSVKKQWTLQRVLNDKNAFEIFEKHAQKAFCVECVAFWTEYNRFLAMKNDIDKQSSALSARSSIFSLGTASLLRANSTSCQNAESHLALPHIPMTSNDNSEKLLPSVIEKSDDSAHNILFPLPTLNARDYSSSASTQSSSSANLLSSLPNRPPRTVGSSIGPSSRNPTPMMIPSPSLNAVNKPGTHKPMLLHMRALKCRAIRFAVTVLFNDFINKNAPFEINISDSVSGEMSSLVARVVDQLPWSATPESFDNSKDSAVPGSIALPLSTVRPSTQPSLITLLWARTAGKLFGFSSGSSAADHHLDHNPLSHSNSLNLSDEDAELVDRYLQEFSALLNRIAIDVKNLMQTNLWLSFVNSDAFIEFVNATASTHLDKK